jgi:hypothetical protein
VSHTPDFLHAPRIKIVVLKRSLRALRAALIAMIDSSLSMDQQ